MMSCTGAPTAGEILALLSVLAEALIPSLSARERFIAPPRSQDVRIVHAPEVEA